jgi:hypothetical protein
VQQIERSPTVREITDREIGTLTQQEAFDLMVRLTGQLSEERKCDLIILVAEDLDDIDCCIEQLEALKRNGG